MTKTLVFQIQYDGSNFSGWQAQPNKRTIQAEFEKSLERIFNAKLKSIISGRTDTAVHAISQIVSVPTNENFAKNIKIDAKRLSSIINNYLPPDVLVTNVKYLDYEFNARFDAIAREYVYIISEDNSVFDYNYKLQLRKNHNFKSLHKIGEVDLEKLNNVAKIFVGSHDFTSFSKHNCDVKHYNCDVEFSYWEQINATDYIYKVKANRFVYSLVRNLVANMLMVLQKDNSVTVELIKHNLESKNRQLSLGVAPANGLYFQQVYYPPNITPF